MRFWPLTVAFALTISIFAAPAAANIGRIKLVSGPAIIERGRARIPATAGLTLERRHYRDGKGGRVGVTFNDNTRFAIGPIARVNIADDAFDDATHKGRFLTKSLYRGSWHRRADRQSNRDAMRVKTPTALLGVRGTRFVVDVK